MTILRIIRRLFLVIEIKSELSDIAVMQQKQTRSYILHSKFGNLSSSFQNFNQI